MVEFVAGRGCVKGPVERAMRVITAARELEKRGTGVPGTLVLRAAMEIARAYRAIGGGMKAVFRAKGRGAGAGNVMAVLREGRLRIYRVAGGITRDIPASGAVVATDGKTVVLGEGKRILAWRDDW